MTIVKFLLFLSLPFFVLVCADRTGTKLSGLAAKEVMPIHPSQDKAIQNHEQASFPGGAKAWVKHVRLYIEAPELPCDPGKVWLKFTVKKTGKLDSIEVTRGLCESADQNAIHIPKNSPLWNPAKVNGKAVDDKMMLQIVYHYR